MVDEVILIMFSVFVIIFQVIVVILFGAFIRLDAANLDNIEYFIGSLVFLLGFAMLAVSRKLISWIAIANLLVVLGINFQWNLLWFQFWKSCFVGFKVNVVINVELLVNCASCTLCCLLSFMDFLGKISWNQILIVSLTNSIGFSLNSAVITYGLKAFDGGGGMQIFFLSGIYGYCIWIFGIRFKQIPMFKPKYSYDGITFSLIGLLLVIYGWPSFNSGGALLSQSIATTDQAKSLMTHCAYTNTLFTLCSAIISAFLYQTPTNKLNINHFIEAILNGGIIISSSSDILLNPVGGLVLGCVASVVTVTILKYFHSMYLFESLPGSTFRLIFGFLSGIFASIIVATRIGLTPVLAQNLLIKGAHCLAGLAVNLAIGISFGIGSGFIIRYIPGPSKQDINNDLIQWDIENQSLPLFFDDQIKSDIINSNRQNLIPALQQQNDLRNYYSLRQKPKSLNMSSLKTIKKQSSSSSYSRNVQPQILSYDITKPQATMSYHVNPISQLQQPSQNNEIVLNNH